METLPSDCFSEITRRLGYFDLINLRSVSKYCQHNLTKKIMKRAQKLDIHLDHHTGIVTMKIIICKNIYSMIFYAYRDVFTNTPDEEEKIYYEISRDLGELFKGLTHEINLYDGGNVKVYFRVRENYFSVRIESRVYSSRGTVVTTIGRVKLTADRRAMLLAKFT